MSRPPYQWDRGGFRRLSLRVLPSGMVRVTSPWFVPRLVVDRFVEAQDGWIEAQRARLQQVPEVISVWGEKVPVRFVSPGRLPRVVWAPGDPAVVVRVPDAWSPVQRARVLEAWEAGRVEEALSAAVPRWEEKTGLKSSGWTVKRMKSRWGSCQPQTARLVFNARLGSFPLACLDYVVVHELAHLVEPSHNARFHALVEGWLPGSQQIRRLLKAGDPSPA